MSATHCPPGTSPIRMKHYIVLLLLSGCASQSMPPASPSPTDIQIAAAAVNAINIPATDYYTYGTTLAAQRCIGWFGDQIGRSSKNTALASELGLLGTIAGVAGGPAGASAAAAMGFGSAIIGIDQANSPAGVDPVATYGLIRKVQQAWLAATPTPLTPAEAYMLVENFAEKCQLPEIRQAIVAAVSTAPVRAVPMSGAAAFGLVPEAPHRVMAPTIVIGEPSLSLAAQTAPISISRPMLPHRRPLNLPTLPEQQASWPANVDRLVR